MPPTFYNLLSLYLRVDGVLGVRIDGVLGVRIESVCRLRMQQLATRS